MYGRGRIAARVYCPFRQSRVLEFRHTLSTKVLVVDRFLINKPPEFAFTLWLENLLHTHRHSETES